MATVITLPRRTVITTTDSEVHGCFRVTEKETFQLGEQAKLSQPCRAHNTSVPVALFRKVWQYKKIYSQNIYSCKSQIYIFCTCMCLVWITCKAMQQMNRPFRLGHRVVMSTKPWSLPELRFICNQQIWLSYMSSCLTHISNYHCQLAYGWLEILS